MIAGYWRLSGGIDPARACAAMLRSGSPTDVKADGALALGRSLRHLLPEDRHDLQPVIVSNGRQWLVFEGRIDNREELGRALGLPGELLAGSSDVGLAAAAWERWGLSCTDRLIGDYVWSAWDVERRRLTLVRAPLAHRGLFYAATGSAIVFASSLAGLIAAPGVAMELDEEALVSVLAGGTYVGTAGSLFRSVRAVRQGHAVEITATGERDILIWDPPSAPTPWRSVQDCGEALREELERAVSAQLRRSDGRVAAHLSGGRDSGAVATTAARLLGASGDELLAYTGAPLEGFSDLVPERLVVDESARAAETAEAHPAMRHRVCRETDRSPLEWLEALQQVQAAPMLTPSNLPWWTAVNQQAAADGATVLLTGQVGNYSVSAGGPTAVRDLAREGELRAFVSGVRSFARGSGLWNLSTRLIGPLAPSWLYSLLRSGSGRGGGREDDLPLLREPWRSRAEQVRQQRTRDHRPPASYRAFLRESLLGIDNAERMSSEAFGLDVRDPTADRRLVELVCSFPARAWFGAGERPAFEIAFGDRLPRSVMLDRKRAYQQSDWFERFRPGEVRSAFHRLARHPFAAELIELDEVDRMVGEWPRGTGWMADPRRFAAVEDSYRNKLLPTLALAAFIAHHFPV